MELQASSDDEMSDDVPAAEEKKAMKSFIVDDGTGVAPVLDPKCNV